MKNINHSQINYYKIHKYNRDLILQFKQIQMHPPQEGSNVKLQDLTREQLKKIQKSMKKPQFMGLLNEYMVEISDPKNKNQYDEYLRQMEREGELPKHMKLVKLKPQFCFRTFIIAEKNKKHEMKLFVNMCSTEHMQKPSCQPGPDQQGQKGYSWQVPHSMGKIRYDQDKHKNPCQVVDCAFHPDSFRFAAAYESFQAMMISIALEGAQKLIGERKETLSKDYVILKNLKCKGENGQPALLPIRYIKGKMYNRGEGPVEQERDLEGKQTKLQKQLNEQKAEYEKQKKQKQNNDEEVEKDVMQEEDLEDKKKPLIEDLEKGLQAPKYSTIYTYTTDYSEFLENPNPKRIKKKLPSKLSIEFKVPRMQNMSEVNQLEINEEKIIMGAGEKYFIDLAFEDMKLKYPLKTNEAKAKYDKKKKVLKIQIPVNQKDIEFIIEEQEKQEEIQEEAKIVENQTWKNKVLDVPEQSVGVKFLEEKQTSQKKEPQKKLVQEIDEDDYAEEQMHQTKEVKEQTKFTISKYYEEKKQVQISTEVLNHIFQQTNKQVIIVVQMKNYQQSQLKATFSDGQFLMEWVKGEKKSIIHLSVVQERKSQIQKMELIKRVGFVALNISKQNNQFWEKQCIRNQIPTYELSETDSLYDKFTSKFNELESKAAQKEKEKEIKMKEQKPIKEEAPVEKKVVKNEEKKLEIQKKMEEVDEEIKPEPEEQKLPENSIFEKLPPQFIVFDAPFIDALN